MHTKKKTKTMKQINIQNALKEKNKLIIDTRTPKEFEKDNIPDSVNYPIFSDEERAKIGTLYKKDKTKAYQEGITTYNNKIIHFIESFKKLDKNKKIIVYCWRGGMRSKTIAELISNLGYDTYQLEGGYKSFREYIRDFFEEYTPPFKLIVLQGYAGCGKTDILKKIRPSIDLEGIAQHRSSIFGAIGLKPISQKRFESRLWKKLIDLEKETAVFIEGEARKIGDVYIPKKIFDAIQKAKTIFITTNIKNRTKRIVKEYFTHSADEFIKEKIKTLKEQISKKEVEKLLECMDEKKYEKVSEYLLTEYYDPKYDYFFKDRKYAAKINYETITDAIDKIEKIKNKIIRNEPNTHQTT